jgi:phosphatidylethanolamine-binding protein (PEBP) family uncharacterized protein
MISTRRIGFAVFAVGTLLVVGGCGDEDDGGDAGSGSSGYGSGGVTTTTEASESAEISRACQDEGMVEQPYGAQAYGPDGATVRMAYASGGSITPCAARLEGSTLVLLVLDPDVSTMDLRTHCAEVDLEGTDVTGVDDGTSGEQQVDADKRALEDALEGNECVPVPIVE